MYLYMHVCMYTLKGNGCKVRLGVLVIFRPGGRALSYFILASKDDTIMVKVIECTSEVSATSLHHLRVININAY